MTSPAALPDPDQVVVPDLPEPIVAYRTWIVDPNGWLSSPMFRVVWPADGPIVACCAEPALSHEDLPPDRWQPPQSVVGPPHPDPSRYLLPGRLLPRPGAPARVRVHPVPCPPSDCTHRGHGCGLYGIRDPHQLDQRMTSWAAPTMGGDGWWRVLGEVWLSGQVLEYSEGYRASRATPKALWRPPSWPDAHAATEQAAARYCIPLIDPPTPPTAPHPHTQVIYRVSAQQLQALISPSSGFARQLQALSAALAGAAQTPSRPPTPRHQRRRRPRPRHRPRRQPAATIVALLGRRHARRWCGGAAAAAALALPAWQRGDLLWCDRRLLLLAAGAGLLTAVAYGARALQLTRILRKDGPDA